MLEIFFYLLYIKDDLFSMVYDQDIQGCRAKCRLNIVRH